MGSIFRSFFESGFAAGFDTGFDFELFGSGFDSGAFGSSAMASIMVMPPVFAMPQISCLFSCS
jgi:hypothetical protein